MHKTYWQRRKYSWKELSTLSKPTLSLPKWIWIIYNKTHGIKFFFKIGSHDTIHTFKIYFVTVFSVFSNKQYLGPTNCLI